MVSAFLLIDINCSMSKLHYEEIRSGVRPWLAARPTIVKQECRQKHMPGKNYADALSDFLVNRPIFQL